MAKIISTLSALLLVTLSFAQVEEVKTMKDSITPLAYDSSYYQLPTDTTLTVYEGLQNQLVVDEKGTTWKIEGYTADTVGATLNLSLIHVENNSRKTIQKDEFSSLYLQSGYRTFRKKMMGKYLLSNLNYPKQFKGLNNETILISPKQTCQISDISFEKKDDGFFGPVLTLNRSGKYRLLKTEGNVLILSGFGNNNQIEFEAKLINSEDQEGLSTNYDDSADGIFGRKIIKRNWKAIFKGGNISKEPKKVAVKVTIDQEGNVVYCEILKKETTETDKKMLKRVLLAARGYKFEADKDADTEQCGKLVFNYGM